MNHFTAKKALISTTALMGVVPVLCLTSLPVFSQNLAPGENFTVTTGSIVVGNPAVTANGVAAGSVTNSGTIIADTDFGIRITSVGGDIIGGVTNSAGGLISGAQVGILTDNSGDISGGITNDAGGTIWGGLYGIAASGYGTITGNIDNSGNITGGNAGIATPSGGISGDIINRAGGTISGGITGIDIAGVMIGSIINNAGATISGGTNGILVNAASVDGGIINSGIIDANGNTAISLGALTAVTAITLNGGRIIGDIIDTTPGTGRSPVNVTGNFSTEGDITVSDLTIAAGQTLNVSPTNTVTLNDMSASTGTWSFGVNAATPSNRLIVTNGDVDLTGATIVTSQITGILSDGDVIPLADGNAAVTGGPGGTPTGISDSSILWDFQLVDGTYGGIGGDATELYMLVAQSANGDIGDNGDAPNNSEVGDVLDTITATTDPELANIISNINNAATTEELNEIIDSVYTSPNRATVMASQLTSSRTRTIVGKRLSAQRTGISTGDDYTFKGAQGLKIWGQVYNSIAQQGQRKNISGYKTSTTGLIVGADTEELHEDMTVGISAGYAYADVKSKDANSSSIDIDSYQVTIYGDYDLDNDIFVKGTIGYVYSTNDTKRHNVGGIDGLTAFGDYSSHYGYSDAELGRNYLFGTSYVTPAITAFYGHHKSDHYIETGAGGANLNINNNGVDILELGAKVDARWTYEGSNSSIIEPRLHLGYRYDLIGNAVETTSRFTGDGTSFTSRGFAPARSTFNLGLGITYYHKNFWIFEIGYDLEYKQDYKADSFLIKAQYKF